MIVIDGVKAYQVMAGVPDAGGDSADLERCVRGFTLTPELASSRCRNFSAAFRSARRLARTASASASRPQRSAW